MLPFCNFLSLVSLLAFHFVFWKQTEQTQAWVRDNKIGCSDPPPLDSIFARRLSDRAASRLELKGCLKTPQFKRMESWAPVHGAHKFSSAWSGYAFPALTGEVHLNEDGREIYLHTWGNRRTSPGIHVIQILGIFYNLSTWKHAHFLEFS